MGEDAEERVRLNELAGSDDPEDVEKVSRLNADLARGQDGSQFQRDVGVSAADRLDEGDLSEAADEELEG